MEVPRAANHGNQGIFFGGPSPTNGASPSMTPWDGAGGGMTPFMPFTPHSPGIGMTPGVSFSPTGSEVSGFSPGYSPSWSPHLSPGVGSASPFYMPSPGNSDSPSYSPGFWLKGFEAVQMVFFREILSKRLKLKKVCYHTINMALFSNNHSEFQKHNWK